MANENQKEPDFYPFRIKDHGWVLNNRTTNEEIGAAFKDLVYQLVSRDFIPGSVAEQMYSDAVSLMQSKSEKARKAANVRWRNDGNREINDTTPTKEGVYDFAKASGLDGADAREWFEMNFVDRPGCDKDGVEIKNWKGHCRAYCKSMAEKRSQKQRRNAKPKAVPEAEDDSGCIDDGTLPF